MFLLGRHVCYGCARVECGGYTTLLRESWNHKLLLNRLREMAVSGHPRRQVIYLLFFVFLVSNENMPRCKNSSSGYYTGREPSPKGLGYCAHSSGVGGKRIGNDGNVWIVQQDKNGRLSWKKYMKNAGTPTKNYARRTPGTPKRTKRTTGTPKRRNTPGKPRNAQQKFKFSVAVAYPRSNSASRLTATEIKLAKQHGITGLSHDIDHNGNVSTLECFGYATRKLDVRDWLQSIGAMPILKWWYWIPMKVGFDM